MGTGEDAGTVAYDASTGGQLWETSYDPPGDGEATAIAVSLQGTTVFITGVGGASSLDYVTIAYDATTGAQLWVASYNGPGNGDDVANAISVSPSGSAVFVTGRSQGTGSGDDYATVAYSAATGSQQWANRFQSPGSADDTAFDIGVSPNGATVFVTGQVAKQTDFETWGTVAYDAGTGSVLWTRRYGQGTGYDNEAYALAVSPDGSRLYVGGSVFSTATLNDMGTVAYDAATGAQEWAKQYNSHGYDYAEDVAISPDGATVFVTGESDGGPTAYDYITVAYNGSTGAPLWKKSYDGPRHQNDEANAVAASPDGSSVFVTGRSFGRSTTGVDYATLAYDAASGAELWRERYDGTADGFDEANDVATSPDGSMVFVTGQSLGSGTSWDYATVAYHT